MFKKVVITLWGSCLVIAAVYWLGIGGDNTILLRNTLYLLVPLLATISGIFALFVFGLQGSFAKTLLLLTLGMACWFIGETLFYYYEFVLHTSPFPSLADLFYISAYPLMFCALVNELWNTKINWKKIHPSVFFLFIVFALILALLVMYFGVYLAYDPHESILTNSIAMGYGIGDLFLIIADIGVLILAWEFRGGKFSAVWMCLFVSFIFMLIGDILFAMFNQQYKSEIWLYKSALDTIWILSYGFFATALFRFGFSLLEAKSGISRIIKKGK